MHTCLTNADSPGRFEGFTVVFLVHLVHGGLVVRLLVRRWETSLVVGVVGQGGAIM